MGAGDGDSDAATSCDERKDRKASSAAIFSAQADIIQAQTCCC